MLLCKISRRQELLFIGLHVTKGWDRRSIKGGLRARGNFELGMDGKGAKLTSATILLAFHWSK